jgi:hypothetical protein
MFLLIPSPTGWIKVKRGNKMRILKKSDSGLDAPAFVA